MFTMAKNPTHVQDFVSGCDVCCSSGNMVSRRASRGSTIGPDRQEQLASSVEQGKDGSPYVIPVPGQEHLTQLGC